MWERTLKDLIRGLRANKQDEAKFIALAIDEIRRELKTKDMELKAAAILKLTYVRAIHSHVSILIQDTARNARIRYELGIIQRCRSHVLVTAPSENSWISWRGPIV